MKLFSLKKTLLASAVGLITLAGAEVANAQWNDLRDCQRAQAIMQREYSQYLMTRSNRDYRQWQRAQREANQECREYRSEVRENWRDQRREMRNAYRIYNNGEYYTYDTRSYNLLRQAVNHGYQQGYRQGQIDRRYGRGFSFYNSNVYRTGTFGFQSYVARDQYQHYFQQGFQRGYEDGFYSTARYGYRSGNAFNILGSVLNTILQIAND